LTTLSDTLGSTVRPAWRAPRSPVRRPRERLLPACAPARSRGLGRPPADRAARPACVRAARAEPSGVGTTQRAPGSRARRTS